MRLEVEWDFHMSSRPTNIYGSIKTRFDSMGLRIRDVVHALGNEGKDTAQLFILSRPARTSAGPGRTRTWDMHNAVRVILRGGPRHSHAHFGWFDGEDYFTYQEEGFWHGGGVWVPEMYAVTDAIESIMEKTEAAVRAVAKP